MSKFFIPSKSVNIFLYIRNNIFFPVGYYDKLFNLDHFIQSYFPFHILLSKKKWVEDCNISFEVELDETELIKLDENFFLSPTSFTLSKLKTLWFQAQNQMEISIANIEISTSKFPKHLVKVDNNIIEEVEFRRENYPKRIKKPKPIKNNLKIFAKYLGVLAISKKVLNLNTYFPKQKYFTDKKYRELENIVINRPINRDDIDRFSKQENIKLEMFLHFYILEKIPKNSLTYIAVILEKYKYDMSDHLAGLIEETKDLDKNLQKTFLLLYGLMLGYDKLPFLGTNTKFIFEQKEDFRILETVYQKVFREKIKKADRLKQLKIDIFEKNFDDILEKFGVSETTLKPNIRKTILESDISVSAKIELFEKFNLRVPKNLRILKLQEIVKSGKFTSKELAEKLKVSVNTVRNYLKEIPVEKNRDGKIIKYFLK